LLDLAANQVKWQHHVTKSSGYSTAGYLLLWRNYARTMLVASQWKLEMIEAACTWPWCWSLQSVVKKQSIFDEQGGKVKRLSPKIVHTIFYQEFVTCSTVFKILLENLLAARLKIFQLTVRKTC